MSIWFIRGFYCKCFIVLYKEVDLLHVDTGFHILLAFSCWRFHVVPSAINTCTILHTHMYTDFTGQCQIS